MQKRWKRVHGLSRCPICGKPDWCLVAPDRSAAICPRIDEGSSRYIEGSGYLHILKVTQEWMNEEYHPKTGYSALPEHNEVLAIRARQWVTDCTNERISELATRLAVTEESLRLLNIGWFDHDASWIFPMLRTGKRLVGVRVRNKSGKKYAVRGSKNGLFIPNNLPDKGVVYVCEGESDTAAMLSCELPTVGRPSCNSGDRLIVELLADRPVVVCMDRDGVGRKGAEELAKLLRCHCPDVMMLEPPVKYKDMREWFHGEGKKEVHTTAKQVLEGTLR